MSISKIKIVFEKKNKKSFLIKSFLLKQIKKNNFHQSNLIIVIGGDGFMLSVIKRKWDPNILYYGINSGNYGFLMNKFAYEKTFKNISNAKKISINPLEMVVKKRDGKTKKAIAINEVAILRQSKQAATISIKKNSKFIIKKLVADGVLISSPAGSTAYNFSVHGPILNLNSKKIAISPISPFRPRRWKSKILNDSSRILVKNLDINKRPVSVTADNYQIRNAVKVMITTTQKIKINLLYDRNSSLQKKIKLEQIRNEIS